MKERADGSQRKSPPNARNEPLKKLRTSAKRNKFRVVRLLRHHRDSFDRMACGAMNTTACSPDETSAQSGHEQSNQTDGGANRGRRRVEIGNGRKLARVHRKGRERQRSSTRRRDRDCRRLVKLAAWFSWHNNAVAHHYKAHIGSCELDKEPSQKLRRWSRTE